MFVICCDFIKTKCSTERSIVESAQYIEKKERQTEREKQRDREKEHEQAGSNVSDLKTSFILTPNIRPKISINERYLSLRKKGKIQERFNKS